MEINNKIVGSPEEIITKHLNLVWKGVNRYKNWLRAVHGVDRDDLYSVGCFGLIRAYEVYNPDKHPEFINYAYSRICMSINRFIYDYNENLSYPRKAREAYYKMFKNNMLESPEKDIMEKLGMKLSDIKAGLEFHKWKFVSTSQTISGGNNKGDSTISTIEDMLISFNDLESNIIIKEIFNLMSDRDKQILYLFYYKEYTKTEIAKIVGISQPQVGRIMKKISALVEDYNKAI